MTLRDDLFFITDIDRWALGHYILYRAATQNLPYETKDGRTAYTAAGLLILGRFITECVDVFNEIHGTTLNKEEIAELVIAMENRDRSDVERIENIPP